MHSSSGPPPRPPGEHATSARSSPSPEGSRRATTTAGIASGSRQPKRTDTPERSNATVETSRAPATRSSVRASTTDPRISSRVETRRTRDSSTRGAVAAPCFGRRCHCFLSPPYELRSRTRMSTSRATFSDRASTTSLGPRSSCRPVGSTRWAPTKDWCVATTSSLSRPRAGRDALRARHPFPSRLRGCDLAGHRLRRATPRDRQHATGDHWA